MTFTFKKAVRSASKLRLALSGTSGSGKTYGALLLAKGIGGKIAVIEGVEKLTGARIQACDLRAGAAMVIAGLAAQGTTEIGCIHHIERGYEDIVRKLSGVGADIRVVVTPDEEKQSQVG